MVIGIPDVWVWLAYLLCILSALVCVAWGVVRWNRDDPEEESADEVKHWAKEEEQVEKKL